MISTGKKDVIVSYTAYFLRLTSNLLLLPVILGMLSSDEYGLWNIYISVGATVNLVDIGFGSVLTRYSTYAFCGAEEISIQGIPVIGASESTNYLLLFRVFCVTKRIYKKLFLLSLGISIFLTVYVSIKAGAFISIWVVLASWGIYVMACCSYVYYVAYNCIIKGMGKVKESNSYYIIQQIVYLVMGYVLLRLKLGLIGLALANLISTFIFRFLNMRFLNFCFSQHKALLQDVENEDVEMQKPIYEAVKENTRGIAVVTISRYISQHGMTLICSLFLPLNMIASIGITNQLVGVIGTLAGTAFSTYMSKMGDLLINKKERELKNTFSAVSSCFFLTYVLGSIGIVFVGPYALQLMGSQTQLLDTTCVMLMLISSFVINNHQRCTNFIMLGNEQPHVKAYFVSSVVTLAFSLISVFLARNALGYIIPNLVVQISYNGWKWPIIVYKKVGYLPHDLRKSLIKRKEK